MASGIAIGIGGSGGGSNQPPDSIVTGASGAAYVIPAGFTAVVNVVNGLQDFNVDGAPILEAKGAEDDLAYLGNYGHQAPAHTMYTNNTSNTVYVTGRFWATTPAPGFQGSTGSCCNKRASVGTTQIGSSSSHGTETLIEYLFENLPLLAGQSIQTDNTWVSWFNPGSQVHNLEGVALLSPEAGVAMRMVLPEGTTIAGGRYVVELYAN